MGRKKKADQFNEKELRRLRFKRNKFAKALSENRYRQRIKPSKKPSRPPPEIDEWE